MAAADFMLDTFRLNDHNDFQQHAQTLITLHRLERKVQRVVFEVHALYSTSIGGAGQGSVPTARAGTASPPIAPDKAAGKAAGSTEKEKDPYLDRVAKVVGDMVEKRMAKVEERIERHLSGSKWSPGRGAGRSPGDASSYAGVNKPLAARDARPSPKVPDSLAPNTATGREMQEHFSDAFAHAVEVAVEKHLERMERMEEAIEAHLAALSRIHRDNGGFGGQKTSGQLHHNLDSASSEWSYQPPFDVAENTTSTAYPTPTGPSEESAHDRFALKSGEHEYTRLACAGIAQYPASSPFADALDGTSVVLEERPDTRRVIPPEDTGKALPLTHGYLGEDGNTYASCVVGHGNPDCQDETERSDVRHWTSSSRIGWE
eukprot:gnl/TRDRNA2_/TRDRNA2_61945_c0_seq1.p1 gnl/TRDRNA2_/TRDRNA2_61945_c0~~gnl/TRDRNA2_/TRDRNA2_61945_c0_seq1.p1  ORF type:complete len:413 (+),score=68.70 gnl/TRDRNA2_/TRDRNA2_61945_c0_seq1:120-1241(+)